jgi:hypothetical protein
VDPWASELRPALGAPSAEAYQPLLPSPCTQDRPILAATLSASTGVYLLTCPRTREQYVGAAYGEDAGWPTSTTVTPATVASKVGTLATTKSRSLKSLGRAHASRISSQ